MSDDNEPATKRDLQELRSETKQELRELRAETKQEFRELRAEMAVQFQRIDTQFQRIDTQFQRQAEQLTEAMRDMQTEVLRAFHYWARPVDMRLRTLTVIEERLGLLEERVGRIERGDLPPRPR